MRLKEQHDGYSSMGLWLKYQRPEVNERIIKPRSKKDKNRWCGGRVGLEHTWHRYQKMRWSDEEWQYLPPYREETYCFVCNKRKTKSAVNLDLPLHLWVQQENGSYAVQISVDGIPQPIKQLVYKKDYDWCYECQMYH